VYARSNGTRLLEAGDRVLSLPPARADRSTSVQPVNGSPHSSCFHRDAGDELCTDRVLPRTVPSGQFLLDAEQLVVLADAVRALAEPF